MNRKWLHELPYLLIALYATKIGQAWRLAEGTDAAHKLLSLMDSLSAALASPLPSFEPHDLCVGLLLGAGFRLFIFIKDSEKKKYRKGREYGSARCTDKLDLTHLDMDIMRRTKLFGDAGARSIDAVVREELAKCANVIYAGGKASRAELTAADKLTSRELRKAVKTLKKNHAQTFGGYFVAIIGPDTMYDLQEDEAFVKVSQYQDKENIYTGEVGRLFGVRLVETTEAKIFEGAGASGADVASVIVLGQYAYGVTSLKGAKPRVIVKPAGSAGTADPLDQISTVGWKMDGFGAKLLQPEYAVRIECGFSA